MEHPSRKLWDPEQSAGDPMAFWVEVFPSQNQCQALLMVEVAFHTLLNCANNTR